MNPTMTFKALAALLAYPSADLLAALPEIRQLVSGERRLKRADRQALCALIDLLQSDDLLDAQERYVALFDRGRATSLNLFEHVHGESRDRGQAMVDLKALYEDAGLALTTNELPDYLPALLEFLSLQPFEVAQEMLADSAHLLRSIGAALVRQRSPYSAVMGALLSMIGEKGVAAAVEKNPPPAEKSIDEEWIEEPVIFGPAGGCGNDKAQRSVVQFVPRIR